MKVIKFRAKTVSKNPETVYGFYFEDEEEGKSFILIEDTGVEVDKDTVEQYINVNDSETGEELYEGDIVKAIPVFSIRRELGLTTNVEIQGKIYYSSGCYMISNENEKPIRLQDCINIRKVRR